MENNKKIRSNSFLYNKMQKGDRINPFKDISIGQILGTDIVFFDDSIEFDLVKKLSKIRKNVSESINIHLQKYSNFDN